jgi:hypothetical protein
MELVTFLWVALWDSIGAHYQIATVIMLSQGPRGTGGGGGGGFRGGGGSGFPSGGSDCGGWASGSGGAACGGRAACSGRAAGGSCCGSRGCSGSHSGRGHGGSLGRPHGCGGWRGGRFDDLQAHQGLPSKTQDGFILGTGQGFAMSPLPKEGEAVRTHDRGASQI